MRQHRIASAGLAAAAAVALAAALASTARADNVPFHVPREAVVAWRSVFGYAFFVCVAIAAASLLGLRRIRAQGPGRRAAADVFVAETLAVLLALVLSAARLRLDTDPANVGTLTSAAIVTTLLFLLPLLGTLLVEVPLVAVADGLTRRGAVAGVLVNLVTNPLASAAFLQLTLDVHPWWRSGFPVMDILVEETATPSAGAILLCLEIVVVVVEMALLAWSLRWTRRRAAVTSIVANALSVGLGWLAFAFAIRAAEFAVGPPLYP